MLAALALAISLAVAPGLEASPAKPATPGVHASAPSARRPHIVWKPIPYGPKRKAEMAAYAKKHYGIDSWHLHPKVIVEHYTGSNSFSSAWNTFAANTPDPELGELPGPCAHFIVGHDGTIYQLVRLNVMCRHTVGLNYVAIGIEHVGTSDAEILHDPAQIRASLELTAWLVDRLPHPDPQRDRAQREPLEPVPQGAVQAVGAPDARRLEARGHGRLPREAPCPSPRGRTALDSPPCRAT